MPGSEDKHVHILQKISTVWDFQFDIFILLQLLRWIDVRGISTKEYCYNFVVLQVNFFDALASPAHFQILIGCLWGIVRFPDFVINMFQTLQALELVAWWDKYI